VLIKRDDIDSVFTTSKKDFVALTSVDLKQLTTAEKKAEPKVDGAPAKDATVSGQG